MGIPAPQPSHQNWIDYFLQIYDEVEMANSAALEQVVLAGDEGNVHICTQKIKELAGSKAKYEKMIQDAASNNDIDKVGKVVFEAIGTLENSQYLCGDPTKCGQPNIKVKILAYPKLRGEVAAFARRGAEPKRSVPSVSKVSAPQNNSSRKAVPRPHTTSALSTERQHQQPNRSKSEASVSSVPVRRRNSKRSESSVSFKAIRKAKVNSDKRKQIPSGSESAGSLPGASRRHVSIGQHDQLHTSRSGIPIATPRQMQEHIQITNQQPVRTTPSEAQLQRRAIPIRNKIARDLELSQRLGAQRRLDAERSAATAQQFGAQGRKTKLPGLQLKETKITEEGIFLSHFFIFLLSNIIFILICNFF